jgi:hypothetical protein
VKAGAVIPHSLDGPLRLGLDEIAVKAFDSCPPVSAFSETLPRRRKNREGQAIVAPETGCREFAASGRRIINLERR